MIRKVIDFIKEEKFELRLDNNYIDIINYININFMEENKISIDYRNGNILIKGNNLTVVKLLDEEVLIKGIFKSIDIRRNDE